MTPEKIVELVEPIADYLGYILVSKSDIGLVVLQDMMGGAIALPVEEAMSCVLGRIIGRCYSVNFSSYNLNENMQWDTCLPDADHPPKIGSISMSFNEPEDRLGLGAFSMVPDFTDDPDKMLEIRFEGACITLKKYLDWKAASQTP